jgi:hypothetical protein
VWVMLHHRRTRSRGTDDRISLALFENTDKAPGHETRFIEITSIEGRLRAASLPLIKLNLTPDPSQHLDTAHADTGPHLIDETRDKKRDFHLRLSAKIRG